MFYLPSANQGSGLTLCLRPARSLHVKVLVACPEYSTIECGPLGGRILGVSRRVNDKRS